MIFRQKHESKKKKESDKRNAMRRGEKATRPRSEPALPSPRKTTPPPPSPLSPLPATPRNLLHLPKKKTNKNKKKKNYSRSHPPEYQPKKKKNLGGIFFCCVFCNTVFLCVGSGLRRLVLLVPVIRHSVCSLLDSTSIGSNVILYCKSWKE